MEPVCYKFTVDSAEEAAALIREKLGPEAKVLSVRTVETTGLSRLWSKPRLEVIAQVSGEAPAAPAMPAAAPDPELYSDTDDEGPGTGDDRFEPSAAAGPRTAAHSPSAIYGLAAGASGSTVVYARQPSDDTEAAPSAAPAAEAPAPAPAAPAAGAAVAQAILAGRRITPARDSRRDLAKLLRRAGISEIALGRIQEAPFWADVAAQPLHRALVDIGGHLRRQAESRWQGGGLRRAAFLGTAGSGRTTALCKWLAVEVFRRARAGHVVTAEFDRPNPPGALPVFCEALGVPLARFPASLDPATPGGFVYLDLPGLSVSDASANRPLARFLDAERIEERVLVLNAAYDHAALRAAYAVARDLGATHVVFTHLDEVPQWGRLWDYLLDGALEPLFLGTGPSLTGDCESDVFGALVRRTLAPNAGAPAATESQSPETFSPAALAASS